MADDFSQIAKDFIDRANGGTGPTGTWRLEVLQKRFSPKAGREIPIRIRRFLKGIPWAQVHDAIRYLISQAPYEGIIYNGVELNGKYRPTLTQWRRDDQEQVGGNAQGSYTLIQDLIEDTDGDKLDTVSADSCSETEETTWVWDAPEIEELPDNKGKQGETYAIRQVRRNEDGTFDYAIVRQVAKTKISGWIVTECDEYSRVSVKVFDNVYGGQFDGDPFTDGTTVLPIPAPCETIDGTLVQVSVAQNPDCTFRVTVQKTEAKLNVEKSSETRKGLRGVVTSETTVATNPLSETGLKLGEQVRNELRPDGLYDVTHVTVAKESVGDIGSSCERTVFEHQHAKTRNEAVRPEDEADFAGGGKTYQVQSRATEEGTWDVTRTETTEIARTGAQKTKQKTLRGVTETTVDRNVDNNDVTVTNIGDRVSVEMTPGGKYNRTVTKVSKESVGDIGSSCETTVFEHRHVENKNVASRPEKEASSAGGGKTYQVQARATEEGTWDVSRTETTELKSEKAQHLKRKTLRGVTETYVDRNVDNSDVTVANIGDEVRVERTPGGLYNRTVTKVSKESVGDIGSNCEKTVFQHTHVKSENVATRPAKEASSAGGGRTYQVQARATEEGTWDVTRTETTEIAQTGAQKTKQKTLRGVTETTVDRNVTNNNVTVTNIGDRVSVEMTPGGKWNRTVTKVSKESVGDIGSSCEKTIFEHRHVENENVVSRPEKEASSAGGGKTYQVQSRATEEGTWDVTRTETTEIAQTGAQKTKQKTLRGITETTVDRNVDNNDVTVTNIGDRVSVEMTPGGKYNRTVTKVSKESVGDIGSSCEKTVFEHRHVENKNVASRPEKEASSAGGGKTYQVQARATEEGTWDVSRTTVEEKAVTGAQHMMRKTLRGVTETFVHRNVKDSSVSVTDIGDEVRVEQTPGGLWNRTETHASHEAVGVIGKSCAATPVVHTDTVLFNVPDGMQPEPQHQVAVVNVENTVETRRTEEGTWDVTERNVVFKEVKDGPVTVDHTHVKDVVKKVNVKFGRNIGTVSDAASWAKQGEVGQNESVDFSVSLNDHGSYDVNSRKTVFREVKDGPVTVDHTHVKDVVKKVNVKFGRNIGTVSDAASWAKQGEIGQNESVDFSVSLNDHGSYDVNSRKTVFREVKDGPVTVDHTHVKDVVKKVDVKFGRNIGTVSDAASWAKQGEVDQNESVDFSVSLNDHGSYDVNSRKTEFREINQYKHGSTSLAELTTVDRTIHLHALRNVVSEPSVPQPRDGWAHTGLSAQLNDHGSMDATWQEHEADKMKKWELEVTGFNYYYQKTVWFRNASEDQYQSLVNTEVSKFETKVNGWISADRPPASVSVTPTVNDTEFVNRYNGSIVVRASWESSQAGQNGEVNYITHYAEYSYNEKAKCPDNVIRTVTKYRKVTYGRGRKKFGDEWNKMILDTKMKQTVSKSFTYNVNTSVWTITYDRIYW